MKGSPSGSAAWEWISSSPLSRPQGHSPSLSTRSTRGILVPPHMHTHEDEFSYVLEGEIGARIGDQVLQGAPGCYIVKPRGIPHTFWNAGSKRARLIKIISPVGFEKFFAEIAELFQGGGAPDFEKRTQIANRYGQTYEMNWVPELTAKYNLKLLGQAS